MDIWAIAFMVVGVAWAMAWIAVTESQCDCCDHDD